MSARFWHACLFTSHDLLGLDGVAIDLFAGLVVRTKRCARQGDARKQSAGTRVAQDLGSPPRVCIWGSIQTPGTTVNGSIRAQFILAAENRFHPSVIHDQQD